MGGTQWQSSGILDKFSKKKIYSLAALGDDHTGSRGKRIPEKRNVSVG
jgi:hypothetical protein